MFSGWSLEAAGNCRPRGMIITAFRVTGKAEQNSAYDLLGHRLNSVHANKNHMIHYILFLILILGGARPCLAYNANLAIEEADTYLRNGQYLEAVGAYQDISDVSPDPEMKARQNSG